MKKEKAQANILATILIILVAIVAVVIVFNIVKGVVSTKSSEVESGFENYLDMLFGKEKIEEESLVFGDANFIIQFEDEPILEKKVKLEKQGLLIEEIENEIKEYSEDLKDKNKNLKDKIKLKIKNKKIGKEFFNIFNGISLYLEENEVEEIKKISGVKKVYPNLEVNATLMDSVPLINADDVWQLDVNGNDCSVSGEPCLTGENITIAIIDTGINYDHPDFGGSGVYQFQMNGQIADIMFKGYPIQFLEGQDKIVWYSNSNINLYDLNVDTDGDSIPNYLDSDRPDPDPAEFEILLSGGDWDKDGSIHGDKIVYEKWIGSYSHVFMYDLQVDTDNDGIPNYKDDDTPDPDPAEFQISTNDQSEPPSGYRGQTQPDIYENLIVWVDDGVVYSKNDIFMYNLSIDTDGDGIPNYKEDDRPDPDPAEIQIISGPGDRMTPLIYGNIIAYQQDSSIYDTAPKGYYIYNLEEGQSTKIGDLRHMSLDHIMGIYNDKIVFMDFNRKRSISMYDVSTGETIDITCNLYEQENPNIYGGIIYWGHKWDNYGINSNFVFNLLSDENYCEIEPIDFPTSKVIGGYDFVNMDNDPMDDHYHGTHVAGIVAGNGVLKGVAPDVKLYAYKVLDWSGSGFSDDVIAAIERAVDPNQDGNFLDHIDIISMSLGTSCKFWYGEYNVDCGPDDPTNQAIDNAVDNGVIAVISAGNSGPGDGTIGSPGTARKAITVGATYKKDYNGTYWEDENPRKDQITSFSSRGPVVYNNESINKPEIVAPGAIICSAQFDSALEFLNLKCGDKHIEISGTSMSTPMVAGAVALIKQVHLDYTPEQIKTALKETAIDLGYDINTQGAGRIDVLEAVKYNFPIEIEIDSCQELTESGTYILTKDLTGAEVTNKCFNIKAENVVLDCQEHSITSDDSIITAIYSNQEHTTIRNCNVSVGGNAVYLDKGAKRSYVYNNVLNNNNYGVFVRYSEDIIIENNEVNNNKRAGVFFSREGRYWSCNPKSTKHVIKGNTIKNNIGGIWVYGDDNLIEDNTVIGNGYDGVSFHGENNVVQNNIILENKDFGIFLSAGLAARSSDLGCRSQIHYLDNNKLIGNKVCDNLLWGIDIRVLNSNQISEFTDNKCGMTDYGTCLSCN